MVASPRKPSEASSLWPLSPSVMLLQANGHTDATLGEWLGYAEVIEVKESTPEFARMPHPSIFSKDCGCKPFFFISVHYLPSFKDRQQSSQVKVSDPERHRAVRSSSNSFLPVYSSQEPSIIPLDHVRRLRVRD